jgi:hypothetical protein
MGLYGSRHILVVFADLYGKNNHYLIFILWKQIYGKRNLVTFLLINSRKYLYLFF